MLQSLMFVIRNVFFFQKMEHIQNIAADVGICSECQHLLLLLISGIQNPWFSYCLVRIVLAVIQWFTVIATEYCIIAVCLCAGIQLMDERFVWFWAWGLAIRNGEFLKSKVSPLTVDNTVKCAELCTLYSLICCYFSPYSPVSYQPPRMQHEPFSQYLVHLTVLLS